MKYINKIPNKWYIEVTEKTVNILGDWRKSGHMSGKPYGYCNQNGGHWTSQRPEGVELSLSDFKRLILKEEIIYEIY